MARATRKPDIPAGIRRRAPKGAFFLSIAYPEKIMKGNFTRIIAGGMTVKMIYDD